MMIVFSDHIQSEITVEILSNRINMIGMIHDVFLPDEPLLA